MKEHISVPALSYYLQIRTPALLQFIRKERLEHLLSGNQLHYRDVPQLLALYTSRHGYQNRKWEIPEWLAARQEGWARVLIEMYGEDVSFPASLAPSQGRQIHELILLKKPRHVVEVGCFIGVSSIWIGSALEKLGQGRLHSIDLFQEKVPVPPHHWSFLGYPLNYARAKVEAAGLSGRVTFEQMRSGDYAKSVQRSDGSPIDFLFLDGDHTPLGCLDDLITYYPHVREGGCFLLHDINPQFCDWDGPRYLLDHFFSDRELFDVTEVETEPNFGMALVMKLKHCSDFPKLDWRLKCLRRYQKVKNGFGFSTCYQERIKPSWLALKNLLRKENC
jgi:predicted O-methyltransferase YrrM